MRNFTAMLASAILAGAAPALAEERRNVADLLPVLEGTQHIEHVSPRLGRALHIFIKRSALAPDDTTPLPVVYLLDADQAFPLLASYSWSLTFSEEMSPSVIVGIGYGSTARDVNFRGTDYTAPSPTRENAGGASTFLKVIEEEIIPLVEERTAVDPARRALVGQSLGGHFVLYQALERPGLFDLGVAINPAIHHSPQWFLDRLAEARSDEHRQSLFISSADNDVPRFAVPGRAFIAAMAGRKNLPWCVRAVELEDHLHLTSMPRAFREAMRWRGDEARECGVIDSELREAPDAEQ